jgi:delta1-piperideine-2-carboxylate reductase
LLDSVTKGVVMSSVVISLEEVNSLSQQCLRANGCDSANATAVSANITAAERDGCHSHGLFRLPGYIASLRSGKVNGAADPRVDSLSPGVIRVDGDGGYAPLSHERSRPHLIERARNQGVAALALVNTHHFSALWVEVEAIARAGMVALACTAYTPSVAPAGARRPFFGTNPLAFGWPRGPDQDPMVFDQATAAMARGEVMIAAREGHRLPAGVGLDANGQATTDPNEVLEGVLLPFGGYKGSALAMMVELLCEGLIGEGFSFEAAKYDRKDGGPPRGGEFMLALDPASFGDAQDWLRHAEGFFGELTALEGVRLPGDRRYANRKRTPLEGVTIPEELHRKILELAQPDGTSPKEI